MSSDTIYSSPKSYNLIEKPILFDIDKDGVVELISSSMAVGNCGVDSTYSDMYTWLMVFDSKLNFVFEPIQVGFYPSTMEVKPMKVGDEIQLVVLNIYTGTNGHQCSLMLFNSKGEKNKEIEFDYTAEWKVATLFIDNYDKLYIIKPNSSIDEIDKNLNVVKKQMFSSSIPMILIEQDIDDDQKLEFIYYNRNEEKIVILRNGLSDFVSFDVAGNNKFSYCSVIYNGYETPQLFFSCDNFNYYYTYHQNPYYYLRYFIYATIFATAYLFILKVQVLQKHRIEKRYKSEKRITELQLKAIKNQMDPHFTLNIINSIGSLFANQDIETANYIFGKYSKLLRTTIINSDNILTTLKSEIEYVENYLALETVRMQDKFKYKIEVAALVNQNIKIPKTLIHTFAQNSVKHGLFHFDGKGELLISVKNDKGNVGIEIKDNGIGREKAKGYSHYSTGKGLEIMDQILELYLYLEKTRITYKVFDLFNESNEPCGTKIFVTIPKN